MNKLTIVFLLIAVGLSFLAYYPAIDYPFMLDDFHYLHFAQNALSKPLTILKPYVGFYRPVNTLSWTILYAVFNTNAQAYHVVVLFMHGINAFLIGYFCFLLSGKKLMFLLGLFLFAINPAPFNTMYWISAFLTSGLVTMFILVSSIMYYKYLISGNPRNYLISLFSCILALGTHESSYILPVLILVLHVQQRSLKKLHLVTPFIALSIVLIILVFSLSNFQKAQGVDLATMRYLSAKYHLANTGLSIHKYTFGSDSLIKFGRSFIQVFLNPFINFYYPDKLYEFIIVFIFILPLFLPFWFETTKKTVITALPFIVIPLVMHAGSYFPVIFSRHMYMPSVGYAILAASAIYLLFQFLHVRRAQIAIAILAIICGYYLIHGISFTLHDQDFPMHMDSLKRDKQVSELKKIFIEYNEPYVVCVGFPFTRLQFDAISSVFFHGKLIRQKDSIPDASLKSSGKNYLVVIHENNKFKIIP